MGSVLNLGDNILDNDIQISNFVDLSEAPDFLNNILAGIEDFLNSVLGSIVGAIKAIIGKVLGFLKALFEMLGLDGLLNGLGFGGLLDSIFNMIFDALGYSGPLTLRVDLLDFVKNNCMNVGSYLSTTNSTLHPIGVFGLIGALMAMICAGVQDAYTALYTILRNTPVIGELVDSLSLMRSDLTSVVGIDSEDPVIRDTAIATRDTLVADIAKAEVQLETEYASVDTLMSGVVLGVMSSDNSGTSITVINEMGGTRPFTLAAEQTSSPEQFIMNYVNTDTSIPHDGAKSYTELLTAIGSFTTGIGSAIPESRGTMQELATARLLNTQSNTGLDDLSNEPIPSAVYHSLHVEDLDTEESLGVTRQMSDTHICLK
jgi:hypothetical protein